ncbi:unnamed protein product [Urochloa decumbens]|uniref:Uncharacterized protein n=1 Tax=Urochloa decumbens TaxID=240449 RepID=A0ABC9FRU0_9POAL
MALEATSPMVVDKDADPPTLIYDTITSFIQATEKTKRSPELLGFPEKFEEIEWRRFYKLLDPENIVYQAMTPWDAAELPHGGTGTRWYFTELQRHGDNVSRKTENGQSWSGKSGRLPKKGYPDDILVAKLVLNKEFHMLELTLKKHKQPTVALCKIWWKSNSTSQTPSRGIVLSPGALISPQNPSPSIAFSPGASTFPQTPSPSTVFNPGLSTFPSTPSAYIAIAFHGASTSQPQVLLEDHFNIIHGGTTAMQIDQPQGQMEGIAQQYVASSEYMRPQNPIVGLFQKPTGQDDQSTNHQELLNLIPKIQNAFSLLQDTRGLFPQIARLDSNLAHKIASEAQNLASYYRNELNSPEISGGAESNRTSTSMSAQLTGAAAVSSAGANPVVLAPEPETATQDYRPYQEPNDDFDMEGSFFDMATYLATLF